MTKVNLNELLESHEIVLVDTCLSSCFRGRANIINKKNHMMNRRVLRDQKDCLERFLQTLNHPNVTTIPEVTREFKKFLRFVSNELDLHYGRHRNNTPMKYQNPRTGIENLPKSFTKDKKLLEELEDLAQKSFNLCKQIEVGISNPRYYALVEMIKSADRLIGLKKSTMHGKLTPNYTDEKLVALLYWASLDQKTSSALITRDKDFLNLLGITPGILGADDFLPYNEGFIEALARNPPKLYLVEKEAGKGVITGIPMGDDSRVLLKSDPQKRIGELKKELYNLWQQYSKYTAQELSA